MELERESIASEASGGLELSASLLSTGLQYGPSGFAPHARSRAATLLFLAIGP